MPYSNLVQDDFIRSLFANAMSAMYREEVPLYGTLLEIVDAVNSEVLEAKPAMTFELARHDELARLSQEYHGAIRLGRPDELAMMRRLFAVMGMYPVGYYDLTMAGVPVHATAFRPLRPGKLNKNPFRIFTSLLRPELIDDADLRDEIDRRLAARRIFPEATIGLIERFEHEGGLDESEARLFVASALEIFRWHSEVNVDVALYNRLHDAHRLVADIVCFNGPHINHLTPRTLDIDAAQRKMLARGMQAKDLIEGPPARAHPILLRQTSFKALDEPVRFVDGNKTQSGTHTARFGEIEQRGMALTPKGRQLYDELLAEAREEPKAYDARLSSAFERFPDDLCTLRREGLGYFEYRLSSTAEINGYEPDDVESLVAAGLVDAFPITYEDFLPVSAAGIFQSNLGDQGPKSYSAAAAQLAFEAILGTPVADPFELYAERQQQSIEQVRRKLSQARRMALGRADA